MLQRRFTSRTTVAEKKIDDGGKIPPIELLGSLFSRLSVLLVERLLFPHSHFLRGKHFLYVSFPSTFSV